MADYKPIVMRRLLALRQFPLFAGADLDELVVIAENVVETTFPALSVVAAASKRLPTIQLILDGRIEVVNGQTVHAWGPREVFGALEVFASRETRAAAVAMVDTHTLQLSAADLADVLEDNFGLLRSMLRGLASHMAAIPEPRRSPLPFGLAEGPLGLVERLIALRHQVPFAGARLHALTILAHASVEEAWPVGTVLARAGEPAVGTVMIVEGSARARRTDQPARSLGPGDEIGALESLAGIPYSETVEVTEPLRALHITNTAILDVIEDHTDLGLAMIATFAGALLDTPAAVHLGHSTIEFATN